MMTIGSRASNADPRPFHGSPWNATGRLLHWLGRACARRGPTVAENNRRPPVIRKRDDALFPATRRRNPQPKAQAG